MTSFRAFAWFVVCFWSGLFAMPNVANSQPLFDQTKAIETTVINSEHVFVAKILRVMPDEDPSERGGDVDIEIEETIKAEPFRDVPYTRLNVFLPYSEEQFEKWKQNQNRLLIVLNGLDKFQNQAIDLDSTKLVVMNADVKLLRESQSVIDAARAATKRLPANVKQVHTILWEVPRDVVKETEWDESYRTGGYLRLVLPVDEHLEKRARAEIQEGRPEKMAQAVRALVYFRSDENQRIVQSLFNHSFRYSRREDNGRVEHYYPVRHAAWQVAESWKIDLPKVAFKEVEGE